MQTNTLLVIAHSTTNKRTCTLHANNVLTTPTASYTLTSTLLHTATHAECSKLAAQLAQATGHNVVDTTQQ